VNAQTDKDAARSVVKITTTFQGPDDKGKIVTKMANGTGWCWNSPLTVVTALHVVAGIPDKDIKVYTDRESKESGAKVIKVLKEADLALLQLDTDLGLTALVLDNVDHNSSKEYYVWGFPHGIFHMSGDDIRFSRSLDPPPTLNSLVNNTDFKFTLEQQGYPLPKVKILRVSSTIQPGHSGAPILTSTGKVIGVADGGLRSGTARLNWALPANYYVPKLLTSNDPFPSKASLQANLYASYTIVPDNADWATQNKIMETKARDNVVEAGNKEITKTWSAGYQEILATMDIDDRDEIEEITSAFGINMSNTRYDVYEDFNTGATITIPAGEYMEYQNGWFVTANSTNTLHSFAMVFDAGDFDNALTNAYTTFENVLNMGYVEHPDLWVMDEEIEDEYEEDLEWEYASYYITRYSSDGNKMLIFNAEVDQSELLVAFMICDLTQFEDPVFLKEFLHYSIALNLADFAGY
jgi:hypothetical protein